MPGLTLANLLRLLGAGVLLWALTQTGSNIFFAAFALVVYLEGALRQLTKASKRAQDLERWATQMEEWGKTTAPH